MESFKITIDNRDFVVLCLPGRPKALLDRTVAEIYEIETKYINRAVKRNPEKFPEDFYFDLTLDEIRSLNEVPNWHLDWKGGHLPCAFTHLGCNMLATILKSPRAVQRAIQIIRTFTALESGGYDRRFLALEKTQEEILQRLGTWEICQEQHTQEIARLQENLQYLLFEGESENSPIIQIQKQISHLENRITTLFLDGRFKKLQLRTIYGDVVKLREYVEGEVEKSQLGKENLSDRLFHQEDRLSRISAEIGQLERKIGALLKEKKPRSHKELPPPSDERISSDQAQELRELVHKKTRGDRKKIMALWRAFNGEFEISRYKHLPRSRFQEALGWVGNW